MPIRLRRALVLPLAALLLLHPPRAFAVDFDPFPDRLTVLPWTIVATHYDGVANDLLTAGLGAAGLQSATAPALSSPPTAEELRRLAIYSSYHGLVDLSASGGYGTFYGPTATADGTVANPQGLVAGDETLAYATRSSGAPKITVMVQVPTTFDPARACIIASPSSGSRGVYGGVATAGEWGLKHGCAVAYTDKGTGAGEDDLQNSLVTLLRGQLAPIAQAGAQSQFTAPITGAQRAAFDAAYPNRFAFKHAHSQVNPERDWGESVLASIRFAFAVIKQQHPQVTRGNTIVIASSISNGGGSSLRAAEQDSGHLIDGVAVAEPNVNPVFDPNFTINQQGRAPLVRHSRPLIDYATVENVYEGCAAAGYALAQAPFNLAPAPARCASLHAAGLLKSADLASQAAEAQAVLNQFGILPEQNFVQPALWFSYVPQALAVTYASSYGRFSVLDNLCGYSFAAIDATRKPVSLPGPAEAGLFGTSNGIPPSAGISLINNAVNLEDRASTPDQDLAGALCLRSLATGRNAATGARLSYAQDLQTLRIAEGAAEIRATGNLHGIPALVVTGRADDILPPNFTSRAYFGLNKDVEGRRSNLRYVEVTNANHLDTLLALPGFDTTLVPLQPYLFQALDLMYAHLRIGAALPESQVVHTTPRGGTPGAAPALTTTNVPPISAAPGTSTITFTGTAVVIPN